jgi:hypothetical protein
MPVPTDWRTGKHSVTSSVFWGSDVPGPVTDQYQQEKWIHLQVTNHEGQSGTRGIKLYSFFKLSAKWGKWLTSRPGRFTPRKETRYPWHRRLGGPQDRPGWVRKFTPPPIFDSRALQLVTSRHTDCAIGAHTWRIQNSWVGIVEMHAFDFLVPVPVRIS